MVNENIKKKHANMYFVRHAVMNNSTRNFKNLNNLLTLENSKHCISVNGTSSVSRLTTLERGEILCLLNSSPVTLD